MKPTTIKQQLEELHPRSWGWALCCTHGDEAAAEELLQVAYLKALSKANEFRQRSSFQTWLFGIIRLTAYEQGRERQRWDRHHAPLTSPVSAPAIAPTTRLEARERREQLRAMLDDLTPRQRELLHLVFYQDLTLEQAAQIMGISPGSASQHYHRAKQNLKKRLGDSYERR